MNTGRNSKQTTCLCRETGGKGTLPAQHTTFNTLDNWAIKPQPNQKGKGPERKGYRVMARNMYTGFQARSRDLRGGRWSWTLTFAQKRSWVGRWSWAEQVGRLLLWVVQVVRQQRCNGHCLSDSVQHSSWKSNCAVHKSLGNGEGTPP